MNLPLLALTTRSLREDSRAFRTHIVRGLLVAGLLGSLVMAHENSRFGIGAPGLMFFQATLFVNLLLLSLLGVSLFSTAITEEKEAGSLGLLKLTGLGGLSILLGKSVGMFINALTLLALQLPFTFLAVTLGGISAIQVVSGYVLLAAYAVALGGLGLLCSVVFDRNNSATRMAMILLNLFFFGPLLTRGILDGLIYRRWLSEKGALFGFLDPLISWWREASAFDRANAIVTSGFDGPVIGYAVTFNLLAGLAMFALAWWAFEPMTRNEHAPSPERIVTVGAKRGRGSRAWEQAAIAWKEYRFLVGGWMSMGVWFLLYGAAIGVFFFMALQIGGMQWRYFGAYTFMVSLWIFPIQAAGLAVRVFGDESKWKTLSGLAMLPLSMGSIARQKVIGASLQLIPGLCWLVIGGVLSLILTPKDSFDMIGEVLAEPGFYYVVATFFFGIHLAAYVSLFVHRGALALTIALIALGNFMFTMPIGMMGASEGILVFFALVLVLVTFVLYPLITHRLEALAAE